MNFSILRHLALFVVVADEGSFTGAARVLGLARSRVSEQISILENHLQVRLLQRTTRSVSLTSDGESVYREAKTLPALVSRLEQITTADRMSGSIAITTTADFAEQWLTERLARFIERYPEIELDLRVSNDPVNLVEQAIDLAFRIGRPRDSSLISRTLGQETPRILASRSYVEQFGEPRTLRQLEQARWIVLKQINPNLKVTLYNGKRVLQFTPEFRHQVDAPAIGRSLIMAGMGLGLHLPRMVQDELDSGELQVIMPAWGFEPLQYTLLYPSRHNQPLRIRTLIDFITESN